MLYRLIRNVLFIGFLLTTSLVAQSSILQFDYKSFASQQFVTPNSSDVIVLEGSLKIYDVNDSNFVSPISSTNNVSSVGKILPYFYPNPFSLRDGGAELGYELPEDMDIQIRIYNMMGNEIYRADYAAGAVGGLGHHGLGDYNRVPFTMETFGYDLSSGIYFFILIHEKSVIAKGKFAVKP